MNTEQQPREAQLVPIVSRIFVLTVIIIGASYLIGNYVF